MENLKDIPGFEGRYAACTAGKIYSYLSNKFLAGGYQRGGYKHVILCKDGKKKPYKIHRLIILTFIGDSELYVNHKNGIKDDNRLVNLESVTHQQNVDHAVSTGLFYQAGEANHKAKLTENDIYQIRAWHTLIPQVVIARLYKISTSRISEIVNRKTWNHV